MLDFQRDRQQHDSPQGGFVQIEGESFYQIKDAHLMREFFMSVTGGDNHWMFVSSRGALTAGRRNADSSLFPYYSADKISDLAESIGCHTIIQTADLRSTGHQNEQEPAVFNWTPFRGQPQPWRRVNLYRNELGSKLIFEEINEKHSLRFRYRWELSRKFGFVRRCELENIGDEPCTVRILDGLQNLMPYGVNSDFQLRFSNLGDAYKKNELHDEIPLGIFYVSSIPSDRAEPSEGLKATIVWQTGLDDSQFLLCDNQVRAFEGGHRVSTEYDIRGRRGSFYAVNSSELAAGDKKQWRLIANVDVDHSKLQEVVRLARKNDEVNEALDRDIDQTENILKRFLSSADAIQRGGTQATTCRHLNNSKYNLMRGGIPVSNYQICKKEFIAFVQVTNPKLIDSKTNFFNQLPDQLEMLELHRLANESGDAELQRLAVEFLPLTFGRRHGDPSRPWNQFDIRLRDADQSFVIHYQGNWRDLFQNWEALAVSFPLLLPGMICRFLNASTADGYNPYRISHHGIDWEKPEPEDPWANFGYWGDHQIIYLVKLIELCRQTNPGLLEHWLEQPSFVYANLPYRIRNFKAIVEDSKNTIDYDFALSKSMEDRIPEEGEFAKLLGSEKGQAVRASMAEKLLVPILAKMSNLIPGGGIWLNTQRPEWNDANNALVGHGLSVVTTCYLHRYFSLLVEWFGELNPEEFSLNAEVADWLHRVIETYQASDIEKTTHDPLLRREFCFALGEIASLYRDGLYAEGMNCESVQVKRETLIEFFETCRKWVAATIRSNLRDDGLYHAYNLMQLDTEKIQIDRLQEMLEGQVAVLSSGILSACESADLLDALRESSMYRRDLRSYTLYPDKVLSRFVDKNQIPASTMLNVASLEALIGESDDAIVRRDASGDLHFNGSLRNSSELREAIRAKVEKGEVPFSLDETDAAVEAFEELFGHKEFTGRSGTFFGYEGLGSVYWHMVSKLALAVQEIMVRAKQEQQPANIQNRIREHYREIRDGIGATKTPGDYGAFPSEPYSHTPRHDTNQQPGLTGQVKEDVLSRMGEIGLRFEGGCVRFDPEFIETQDFLENPSTMAYFDVNQTPQTIDLAAGEFSFLLCQTPVIYHGGGENKTVIEWTDGRCTDHPGCGLPKEESQELFARSGAIRLIRISISKPSQAGFSTNGAGMQNGQNGAT